MSLSISMLENIVRVDLTRLTSKLISVCKSRTEKLQKYSTLLVVLHACFYLSGIHLQAVASARRVNENSLSWPWDRQQERPVLKRSCTLHPLPSIVLNGSTSSLSPITGRSQFSPLSLSSVWDQICHQSSILDTNSPASCQFRVTYQCTRYIVLKHNPLYCSFLYLSFHTIKLFLQPLTVFCIYSPQIINLSGCSETFQLPSPSLPIACALAFWTSLPSIWSLPPRLNHVAQAHTPYNVSKLHKLQLNVITHPAFHHDLNISQKSPANRYRHIFSKMLLNPSLLSQHVSHLFSFKVSFTCTALLSTPHLLVLYQTVVVWQAQYRCSTVHESLSFLQAIIICHISCQGAFTTRKISCRELISSWGINL